jgi:hypothetical protein
LCTTNEWLIAEALLWFCDHMGDRMEENNRHDNPRGWLMSVLTDIHFWVPVVVLIGGLLLLRSIH